MESISVVIPTAGQSEFLENALRSVARQTLLSQIEEVIVSENGGDQTSEAVCARFPQLPIRYIFHEPSLPILQHFHYLFEAARTDLIACLHDDDWWAPGHLQAAYSGLAEHADVVAWFSASFFTPSVSAIRGWIQRPGVLWLAAERPDFIGPWLLEPVHTLTATAILTPFHWSSMVVRREPLHRAGPAILCSHPYQADRRLHAELAIAGRIGYEPIVNTYVRWHSTNLSKKAVVNAEKEAVFRECTEAIWKIGAHHRWDLTAIWHSCLSDLPNEFFDEIGRAFRRAMDDRTLAERHFRQFLLPPAPIRFLQQVSKKLYRRIFS